MMTFEEMYEQNFRYVYNVVYMNVLHREVAEDLTGETFLKALQSFERYDPERAQPATWLCAIARNEMKMYYRSAATRLTAPSEQLPETGAWEDEDERVRAMAINREAERLLHALSDKERELIALRLGAQLSFREVGELLETSEKAATERYRRVIAKCRRLSAGRQMEDLL